MRVRYRTNGELYIPQYLNKDGWVDFKVRHCNWMLEKIVIALANINNTTRWHDAAWSFIPEDKKEKPEMAIYFKDEIRVMAFMGAAKAFYTANTKEVEVEKVI